MCVLNYKCRHCIWCFPNSYEIDEWYGSCIGAEEDYKKVSLNSPICEDFILGTYIPDDDFLDRS